MRISDWRSDVCSSDLKIDGRFIRDIADDPLAREIVRAIHQVARAAGKRTVAEFVDDSRKLAVLKEIGIDYAQGYLFSPAVPPQRLAEMLNSSTMHVA